MKVLRSVVAFGFVLALMGLVPGPAVGIQKLTRPGAGHAMTSPGAAPENQDAGSAPMGVTTAITPGVLEFHAADGEIAYNWFSYIPSSVAKSKHTYIWITGVHGNLITDDYDAITAESELQATWRIPLAEEQQYIMLTPVIPRPETEYVYVVAFSWKVFLSETDPFCQRPDVKLNLMIDRLIQALRDEGYDVDEKVLLDGFSAGATFAQRYTLLHPERVRAVAAGHCGGAATLPESLYDGYDMDWPVGTHDFAELVGDAFDQQTYKDVPQLYYIGDLDTNNSTLWGIGELWRTWDQIDFLNATFGESDPVRLQGQSAYMRSLGYNVTFNMYPGVGHQWTDEMIQDTFDFFRKAIYPWRVHVPLAVRGYAAPMLPIAVDGQGGDWLPFSPVATDPQGDSTGGPHTDLKAVYVETDPNYVYLMLENYDPPLRTESTIELNMAIFSSTGDDWLLHTNTNSDGSFYAWTDLDGDGQLEPFPISGQAVAWGDVLEIRLPLAELGEPAGMQPTIVAFWCEVNGNWTWVDLMVP